MIDGLSLKNNLVIQILNLSLPILMGAYIFLAPMPFPSANEICYYLSIGILLILFISKKTTFSLRSPLTLPFALFFFWAAFGLFFTLDFRNSLHDLRTHLLEYLMVFYLLSNYFNTSKRLNILAWTVIASATIFSIGAVIQYYFIEGFPFSKRLGYTFADVSTNKIGFLTIPAVCFILFFLNQNKSTFYRTSLLGCLFILLGATLLTQSRGSLLGLLTAFAMMSFYKRKFIILMIMVVLSIALFPGIRDRILNTEAYTQDLRIKINRLTLEVIKLHPVTGIGFGMQIYSNQNVLDLKSLNDRLPVQYRQTKIVAAPHNTFLDVMVRTGFIGFIFYVSILITSLWMLWKIFQMKENEFFRSWAICLSACFFSFLIPSFFSDTSYGIKAIMFYTILAMINIVWNMASATKRNPVNEN